MIDEEKKLARLLGRAAELDEIAQIIANRIENIPEGDDAETVRGTLTDLHRMLQRRKRRRSERS